MERVKYFRYDKFGPVTLYTGRMGSGLTLGAVIQLVKTRKYSSPPPIVSNLTLHYLDYKRMEPRDINSYLESPHLLLFDSGYSYFSIRRVTSKESTLWLYFFNQLRKTSSKAILTTSMGLDALDRRIRSVVSDIVIVRSDFRRHQKLLLTHYKMQARAVWVTRKNEETGKMERVRELVIKPVPVAQCLVKRSGRYWKYYNTFEIPDLKPDLNPRRLVICP